MGNPWSCVIYFVIVSRKYINRSLPKSLTFFLLILKAYIPLIPYTCATGSCLSLSLRMYYRPSKKSYQMLTAIRLTRFPNFCCLVTTFRWTNLVNLSRNSDEISVIGYTRNYQLPNFRCSQWRKSRKITTFMFQWMVDYFTKCLGPLVFSTISGATSDENFVKMTTFLSASVK